MKILYGMLVALMLCGSAWAQDLQQIRIGSKGASFSLPAEWKRMNINADLGPDQFVSKKRFFLVIMEHEKILGSPEEFHKLLSTMTESMKIQDPTLVLEKRPFISANGMGDASIICSCKIDGIRFTYEIHLVGRDGLFYLFMGWSSQGDKLLLAGEMKRLVSSLKMPAPGTKWGKNVAPSPVILKKAGYVYKFNVRKSLFDVIENTPAEDYLCKLINKEEDMACYLFPVREIKDLEEQAGLVLTLFRGEFPNVKEKLRENVPLAGRKCLRLVMAGTNKAGVETSFVIILVPLEKSKCAEIRFVVSTKLEWRQEYLDAILKTFEILEPAKVEAFPEVAAKQKPGKPLLPAQRAILEASTLLATFEPAPNQVRCLPDGSLFGLSYDKAMLAKPGATVPVPLLAFEDRCYTRHAACRDETLWYSNSKGKLVCFKNGVSKTLDGDALLVEAIGKDSLLISREEKPPVVFGFELVAGNQLIVCGADKQERILKKTELTISHAAPDAAGKKVLVAASADWRLRHLAGKDTELEIIEIESGRGQALPDWKMVDDVVGAADGWLVNGQPKDKVSGLYRVGFDGQLQLLVSGDDCHGVALTGEELIYSTSLPRANALTERNPLHVYRVPLAIIKKDGPLWQPFFGSLLQRIAATACERAKLNPAVPDGFTTRQQFDEFMAIARKASREMAGADLPATPEGVNALLSDYSAHQDLKAEGLLLLSAILTQSLLDQNAQWFDGTPAPFSAGRGSACSSSDSAFAVVVAPGAIVASLLYDEESDCYQPATSLVEQAKGRPIVLSRDPEASAAKIYGESDRNLQNLLKVGNLDAISSLLKKEPKNLYLRELVYGRLLATQPLERLEQLAGAFASAETPLLDLKMILAVQTARAGKGDQAKQIETLRAAIIRFPEEPAFYAMLGSAYEKSGIENSGEYARKCYDAVLRLAKYGTLAQQAKAALARIDGKPADDADDEFGDDEE